MRTEIYANRLDAAEQLIPFLKEYANNETIVLAIPRGAVPMGYHIAKALHVPFDILLVKKIGYPGNPELAVGAVSIDGRIVDPEFAIRKEYIEQESKLLREALKERETKLRGGRLPLKLKDRTIIIVDDGMATGNSMLSAVEALKNHSPNKIIVAVPVASKGALSKLENVVDELICLHAPHHFTAVAEFYSDFTEVNDNEVMDYLTK